jgi:hypothetical protein
MPTGDFVLRIGSPGVDHTLSGAENGNSTFPPWHPMWRFSFRASAGSMMLRIVFKWREWPNTTPGRVNNPPNRNGAIEFRMVDLGPGGFYGGSDVQWPGDAPLGSASYDVIEHRYSTRGCTTRRIENNACHATARIVMRCGVSLSLYQLYTAGIDHPDGSGPALHPPGRHPGTDLYAQTGLQIGFARIA